MTESILFLTGHLARPRLEAVLQSMQTGFDWKVLDIGVKVAALMTEEIITRRLPNPVEADKIMLPGRCRADLDRRWTRRGAHPPVTAAAHDCRALGRSAADRRHPDHL